MDNPFDYLLRSAACLALFYVYYWLVLRREAFHVLNRLYLLGAAVFSLALPLVRVTSPFLTTTVAPGAAMFHDPALPSGASAPEPGGPSLLLVVYLAGAGLVFLRFLVRLAVLFRVALRCGCERRSGLRVILCRRRGEPFSFFNFIFLDRSQILERDMDRILAHELAHVRGLHSLDIVLSECLSIVQWFNPFVWLYKRSLRETHEYLADRAVIAQGCSLAGYQLLLVEQHVGRGVLALASNLRTSQIKRRLIMLSRNESKGWARWKPLWLLPLALFLVLAFAESRTVVQAGPVQEAVKAQEAAKAETAPPSDEEMEAALKEKLAKLAEMKKKNADTIEALKAKYEQATGEDDKIKIKQLLKEESLKAKEIEAKGRMLSMKKLELAINRETDPAKKEELKMKLEQMAAVNANPAKFEIAKKHSDEMKKLELAIAGETDPAKKENLKKKLEELQHAAQYEAAKAAEIEKKKAEKK